VVPLLSLSLNTPKRNGSLKANRSFEACKGAFPARGIVAEPPAK
jgi:hypothetical protein